jgi:2-polyprenyl-6-methoxyphenol hydroxylase-like FAD-dependent oxidoreductase
MTSPAATGSAHADLVVVGAGPAGAALAIAAGRAGLSVSLLEAHHLPHEKACGEGIMPSGVRALARLGLGDAGGGRPFRGVRYRGHGVDVTADFPRDRDEPTAPFGLGQRRVVLDRALLEAARATPGVRVFERCSVDALELRWGRVVGVRAGTRAFRGRVTVGADGARSAVRRLLGLDVPARGRAATRVGWRMHFRLASRRGASSHVEVYVGRGHEIYVTPLPDECVLVAALAGAEAPLHDAEATLRSWVAEHPTLTATLSGATVLSPPRGRYPLVQKARAGVAPGAVLLGDAAGNSDPLTGGGISQALLSAELLGAMLPEGLRGSDQRYDGEWLVRFDRRRRALLRDYRWLTAGLVEVARVPALTWGMLHAMRAYPPIMRHMVGVAAGLRRLAPI